VVATVITLNDDPISITPSHERPPDANGAVTSAIRIVLRLFILRESALVRCQVEGSHGLDNLGDNGRDTLLCYELFRHIAGEEDFVGLAPQLFCHLLPHLLIPAGFHRI
jgi:hypothetical protein